MSREPFDYDYDDWLAAGGDPRAFKVEPGQHDFDDDCVCIKCGFDGAEWSHWKKWTYEGKASDAKQPRCER